MASQLNTVSAPLADHNLDSLHQTVAGLSAEQLVWASGYLAGLAIAQKSDSTHTTHEALAATPAAGSVAAVTILYGSQTGNGRGIADKVHTQMRTHGSSVRVLSMLDYRVGDLKKESHLVIVVSTHGEGDPPDDAEDFHEFLFGRRAPKLPNLQFSVLALGDSSYAQYCQTGRQIDERLAQLGARRFAPLVECDVDFSADADEWSAQTITTINQIMQQQETAPALQTVVTPLHAVSAAATYSTQNPFNASVINVQKITGRGSDKDVRHIEIDLSGSNLSYQAGDALGVLAPNPKHLAVEMLRLLRFNANSIVSYTDGDYRVEEVLREHAEITQLSRKFLQQYAQTARQDALLDILQADDKSGLTKLIDSHQVIDILKRFPPQHPIQAQEFVATLRPLAPRLYSISSSPEMYPDEVHITVAVVAYEAFGQLHSGAASFHLGRSLSAGDQVTVFIQANSRFRLPHDPDAPVIMLGAGTGVAPYRAFLDEREANNATGDSWLIYGDRTFNEDFLYQVEWQRHLKSKRLTRLDVAFSRDQNEKVYVQQRVQEQSQLIYTWLERGAFVYLCGDAKHLAPDVHNALIEVIKNQGQLTQDAASEYLKQLRREGRYQRDVY